MWKGALKELSFKVACGPAGGYSMGMAIFHLHASYVSRGSRGSVCANSAYISGEKVTDNRTGETYSFGGKDDEVVYKKLFVPEGKEHLNTPEKLWNDIEEFEDKLAELRYGNYRDPVKQAKSLDAKKRFLEKAVTGYKLECALPIEFTLAERKELVDRIAQQIFESRNLPYQGVIHDKTENPHAHFLSSFRPVVNGEYSMRKVYYTASDVKKMRQDIADVTNAYALEKGYEFVIDSRSLEAQGIDREPTRHEGWWARDMGENSRIVLENQEILSENAQLMLKDPQEIIKKVIQGNILFSMEELKAKTLKLVSGDLDAAEVLQQRIAGTSVPELMERTQTFGRLVVCIVETRDLWQRIQSDSEAYGIVAKKNDLWQSFKEALSQRTDLAVEVGEDFDNYKWLAAKVGLSASTLEALGGSKRVLWNEGANPLNTASVPDLRSGDALNSLSESFGEGSLDQRMIEVFNLEGIGKSARGQEMFMGETDLVQEEKLREMIHSLKQKDQSISIARKVFNRTPEKMVSSLIQKAEKHQGFSFSPEQSTAIENLVKCNRYASLVGKAGTGKTTVLRAVSATYKAAGYRVMGTSFQGAAVGELSRSLREGGAQINGSLDSQLDGGFTLSKLTQEWKKIDEGKTSRQRVNRDQYEITEKTVVIVDEAAMVPPRLLLPLLERAERANAKVIMVGDPGQIKAIDRADYGRLVLDGGSTLSDIRRQSDPEDRKASFSLSQGNMRGALDHYEAKGCIGTKDQGSTRILNTTFATKLAMVNDYVEAVLKDAEKAKGAATPLHDLSLQGSPLHAHMAMGFRNEDVKDLNQGIRSGFKAHGLLTNEFQVLTGYGSVDGKAMNRLKADREIAEVLKEMSLASTRLASMRSSSNVEAHPASKEGNADKKISYGEAKVLLDRFKGNDRVTNLLEEAFEPKSFAVGEKILFTKNCLDRNYLSRNGKSYGNKGIESETPVYNGNLGVVQSYDSTKESIEVLKDDGDKVSVSLASYHTIDLGYAISINRSQGKTVNNTYTLFNNTNNASLSERLFYVALTRHKIGCVIYHSKEYLGDKQLAQKISSSITLTAKDMEDKGIIKEVRDVYLASVEAREIWSDIQKDLRVKGIDQKDNDRYSDFLAVKNVRDEGSKVLLNDREKYRPHTQAAGLKQENLERWAGKSSYKPADADIKLEKYRSVQKETAQLWKSILHTHEGRVADHPSYADFKGLRYQRNQLAYELTAFGPTKQIGPHTIHKPGSAGEVRETHRFNLKDGKEWQNLERHTQEYIKAKGKTQKDQNKAVVDPAFYDKLRASLDVEGFIEKAMGTGKRSGNNTRYGSKGSLSVDVETGVWTNFKEGTSGSLLGSKTKPGLLSQSDMYKGDTFKESLDFARAFVKDNEIAKGIDRILEGKSLPKALMTPSTEADILRREEAAQLRKHEIEMDQSKKIDWAQGQASKSKRSDGTLVETYLKSRGISVNSTDVKYRAVSQKIEGEWIKIPSMAAIIRDAHHKVQGIQTTLLTKEGQKDTSQEVAKRTQGILNGGYVLIQQDTKKTTSSSGSITSANTGSNTVILAEGVETALSLKQAGIEGEIRAVLGINNFKTQQGLEGKEVIIAADNDTHKENPQLEKAIKAASEQFGAKVVKPSTPGQDFNDVLQKEGSDGVMKSFDPSLWGHYSYYLNAIKTFDPSLDTPSLVKKEISEGKKAGEAMNNLGVQTFCKYLETSLNTFDSEMKKSEDLKKTIEIYEEEKTIVQDIKKTHADIILQMPQSEIQDRLFKKFTEYTHHPDATKYLQKMGEDIKSLQPDLQKEFIETIKKDGVVGATESMHQRVEAHVKEDMNVQLGKIDSGAEGIDFQGGNHEDKLSFLASVEKDSVAMSYVNHEHLSQQIESEKVQQQQNAAQEQQESQEEDIDISFSR